MYIDFFNTIHANADEVCLMLHGFPAASYPDPLFEKNRDLGLLIAKNTKYDVFLPHYRGLGKSPGSFSFLGSIEDSLLLATDLVSKRGYKKIHLVGHSWGGLVSMNLLPYLKDKIGTVILLSPFSEIPDPEILKPLLVSVSADIPISYSAGSIDGAVEELMTVRKNGNPRSIANTCAVNSITIIQGKDDDEVPVSSTRDFVNCFPRKPRYIEIDSDHKFLKNRDSLKVLFLEIMANASYAY